MILRLLYVRVLPGAAQELVSRLREQVVPETVGTDGLVGLNYGFRQEGAHTYGVAVSVWRDYEAIFGATAGQPDRIGSAVPLDDVVADARTAHYEIAEWATADGDSATSRVTLDGAVIGVIVSTIKQHVEPKAFDLIRESAAAIYEAGAIARYIGRRIAGSHSEVAAVAIWPDRAALRRYARGRPEGFMRPDYVELLEAWKFETYDSLGPSRLYLSSAGPAVLLADDQGRYLDASPGVERVFGLPGEFMLGRRVWDFTPQTDLATGQELWQRFLDAGEQAGEYELMRPDGARVRVPYRARVNCPERGVHASVLSLHDEPADDRPVEEIVAETFPQWPAG